MEIWLRKNENTLIVTGSAVILLCLWNIAKSVMFYTLVPEAYPQLRAAFGEGIGQDAFGAVLAAVFAADLVLRVYTGLRARSEGMGKRSGTVYIVLAGVFAAVSLLELGVCFASGLVPEIRKDLLFSAAFELTSLITSVALIRSALTVKKLRRARKAEV